MHIPRKPGDSTEADWARDKLYIVDRDTGEAVPAYLFVGVLPFSMYAYAEACPSMDMESWIYAHVNMFRYFGGSVVMLVPDNLKTGVDHNRDWFTPQINRTYRELAEHYHTAVVPARVRRPKDKAGAEGTVGVVSTRIIAALRNRKFFSLPELNQAIREKLEEHNNAPFSKKRGQEEGLKMWPSIKDDWNKYMKTLGNILWFVFGGLVLSLLWGIAGAICCCTIIAIPVGVQCFKFASFVLWPFGRDVVFSNSVRSFLLNVIWIIIFGWELSVASCLIGLLWCITIVGIPFGTQFLKIAKIALMPFGTQIVA